MQVFYCMQVLHASLLLQPSVQLQYFHARLAGVTAEIPPTWQLGGISARPPARWLSGLLAATLACNKKLACKFFYFILLVRRA